MNNEKEVLFQKKLDDLYEEIQDVKKEISAEGGYIEYGKVYMEKFIYVAEIYTYERTEFESYGYTEIHRNMIPIDSEMVDTIKSVTQTKDKDAIYDFFFDAIMNEFGEYMGNCTEKLEVSNLNVTVPEDNRYSRTDDFLIEYSFIGQPEDMYFSFYKTPVKKYNEFESVNLSYRKVLTDN